MAAVAATATMGCRPSTRSDASHASSAESSMPSRLSSSANQRMPVLFIGHGTPMNAIEDNRWSRGFAALAKDIPRPKAIIAISAHWYVNWTMLTSNPAPRTIHDFNGFPQSLYEINYPAPGNVDLAKRVRTLIGEERSLLSDDWGIDHGTWSVLKWMFPYADIPVIQLSINQNLSPSAHYELGRSLEELRHEGVLIFASGNIVHNLRDAFTRLRTADYGTPDWARQFDEDVAEALRQHDAPSLVELWPNTENGRRAHPTPDHWLPLLYAVGASNDQDTIAFPLEGFDLGSLSMRAVRFG